MYTSFVQRTDQTGINIWSYTIIEPPPDREEEIWTDGRPRSSDFMGFSQKYKLAEYIKEVESVYNNCWYKRTIVK